MAIHQQMLTKEALEIYRSRWDAVTQIETEEKQQETITQRWQRLNAMLQLSIALGIYEKMRNTDVEDVRARWIKLKANYK